MAGLNRGITFTPPTSVTAAKLHQLVDRGLLSPVTTTDFAPANVAGVDGKPGLRRLGYAPSSAAKGTHDHDTTFNEDAVQVVTGGIVDGAVTEDKLANGVFELSQGGVGRLAPVKGGVGSFHQASADPIPGDSPTLTNEDFILRSPLNTIHTFTADEFGHADTSFDHLRIVAIPDFSMGVIVYDVNHDNTFPLYIPNATIPFSDFAAGRLLFAPAIGVVKAVTTLTFRFSVDGGVNYGGPNTGTIVVTPVDEFVQVASVVPGQMLAVDESQPGDLAFTSTPGAFTFTATGKSSVKFFAKANTTYIFTLMIAGSVVKSNLSPAGPSMMAMTVNGPANPTLLGYVVSSATQSNNFYQAFNLISDASNPAVTDFSEIDEVTVPDTQQLVAATVNGAVNTTTDGTITFTFSKHSPDSNILDNIAMDSIQLFITVVSPLALPTFSPVAGEYDTLNVTINTEFPVDSIYYSTDGSDPNSITGNLYTGPINLTANTTLKARAFKTGYVDSDVATAVYVVKVADPVFTPVAGTYTSVQLVTLSTTTAGATIRYTTDGSTPTTVHGTIYTVGFSVATSETVKAIAYNGTIPNSNVVSAAYVINIPVVATPTFSPGTGSYDAPQTVTISSTTSGATIYYTTDGSTPTTGSTVYSSPITTNPDTANNSVIVMKALATKAAFTNSAIGTATHTFKADIGSVDITSGSSTPTTPVIITFTCPAGAHYWIAYTTDGSTPDAVNDFSFHNGGTLTINSDQTLDLKFVVVKLDPTDNFAIYQQSDVVEVIHTFTFQVPTAPVINSPPAGASSAPMHLDLTVVGGASCRWTTDGTTPTDTHGPLYTGPGDFAQAGTFTLQTVAYHTGWVHRSTVTSEVCTIT